MNVYVDAEVLAVGTDIRDLFDMNTGETVTVRVTRSGFTVTGGTDDHPQRLQGFEAIVTDGYQPGRTLQGSIIVLQNYRDGDEYVAFIDPAPGFDRLARDLRLSTVYSDLKERQPVLKHIMQLRDELVALGWKLEDILARVLPMYELNLDAEVVWCDDQSVARLRYQQRIYVTHDAQVSVVDEFLRAHEI